MVSSAETRTVQGRLEGRVQGVSFRASMQREARRNGVTGWVRNTPDGAVEFLAHGEARAVRALVDWARRGPPGASVDGCNVFDVEEAPEARDFEVRG